VKQPCITFAVATIIGIIIMSNLNFQNIGSPIQTGAGANVLNGGKAATWYEALAKAWGQSLDGQAGQLESLAQQINGGDDKPSTLSMMTAESAKMQFMATSSSSSLNSVGSALETMARKG
jgi:hypothetical protein